MLSDPEKRSSTTRAAGSSAAAASTRRVPARRRRASAASATSSPTSSAAAAPGAAAPSSAAAGPSAGATSRPRSTSRFEQAMDGAQVPVSVAMAAPCPTCRGSGAKPGTTPTRLPGLQRPRRARPQSQGLFSISQPCHVLRRHRHRDRGAVPAPAAAAAQTRQVKRYKVNIPAGVKDGSRVRLAGKGEPGSRGGPPGDLYVITRVGPSRDLHAQGRQPRGGGADHDRRGHPRRARWRCRRSTGSKRIRVPAGHPARHGPAPAGRGPAAAERQGPRRHPLPAVGRGAAHAVEGAAEGGRRSGGGR